MKNNSGLKKLLSEKHDEIPVTEIPVTEIPVTEIPVTYTAFYVGSPPARLSPIMEATLADERPVAPSPNNKNTGANDPGLQFQLEISTR